MTTRSVDASSADIRQKRITIGNYNIIINYRDGHAQKSKQRI
jgi:hypothetical protein